jgi:hypothetical protein
LDLTDAWFRGEEKRLLGQESKRGREAGALAAFMGLERWGRQVVAGREKVAGEWSLKLPVTKWRRQWGGESTGHRFSVW